MVDPENLSRPAPELIEDGVPATVEIPESQLLSDDQLEGELPPLDRPQAVLGWGTTAAEQLGAEPLDIRVAREEPEVDAIDDDDYTDRQIVEPGADGGLEDDESDNVGELDARLEDSLSAEEAAVRVVDEPVGMNYDPDPGYVEDNGEELP